MAGYHKRDIVRGQIGEPSKIQEELEEFLDALEQNVQVMALIELSDLLGAIEAWLEKNHPSITIQDLLNMKDVTKNVFKSGYRQSN